jgi:lipopolysaccharide export system permease protein
LNKLDIYIIKKFLGTFFFTLLLVVCVIVVFDVSEKIQDFIDKEAPLKAIVFDYYLNYIPYLANQFSPLFIFISVIFFTSKTASNSEIVAILASGVSFNRFLRPYIITALFLSFLSLYLNNFIIPKANEKRLAFEEVYYRNKFRNVNHDIHIQIDKQTYIYMSNFVVDLNMANNFSIETINDGKLSYKLIADNAKWDSTSQKWSITNYVERHISDLDETITKGSRKDTTINLHPSEFKRRKSFVKSMDYYELNAFIKEAKFKGDQGIVGYEVERQNRNAYPFATVILTLIGVAVSSRKVRGGIGLHIFYGLLISFSFILFMQISSTFAINSGMSPIIAVWMPNVLYGLLALYLIKKAPK